MVTMVKSLAEQEHYAALAQLASRISANKKFGADADDDLAAFVQSRGPDSVSIRRTDFVHEPRSAIRSDVAAVLIGSKTFCHDAVNSVWRHKQVDRSGQGHVSD